MAKSGSNSRRKTGEVLTDPVPFTPEFTKTLMKSSPRFGSLSHHSFFSRHNPHPHRVKHIQGLNGRPVCMVRDDWFVTSSLFPHPLLKSHVFRRATIPPCGAITNNNSSGTEKKALFSEAWRDELKEIAAKITLSSRAQKKENQVQTADEPVRRKTQYSSETGRIIPPFTKLSSHSHHLPYHQPFHDQELLVLELLCQILQTDSLSTVQQWLVLAGQREKDLVMGMLKQAFDGVNLSDYHQQASNFGKSAPPYNLPPGHSWRKPQRVSSCQAYKMCDSDKPERIGDAEVLEIHTEDHTHH